MLFITRENMRGGVIVRADELRRDGETKVSEYPANRTGDSENILRC